MLCDQYFMIRWYRSGQCGSNKISHLSLNDFRSVNSCILVELQLLNPKLTNLSKICCKIKLANELLFPKFATYVYQFYYPSSITQFLLPVKCIILLPIFIFSLQNSSSTIKVFTGSKRVVPNSEWVNFSFRLPSTNGLKYLSSIFVSYLAQLS